MDLSNYRQWKQQLSKTQLLQWNELPSMGLYVDQLLSLVNGRLSGLALAPLSKSMINNYVKKGVIMAPIKKKYSTNQMAAVTVITLLKSIYPLDSLQEAFAQLEINEYPQAVYDRFVDLFNALLRGESIANQASLTTANEQLLRLAAQTAYDHLLANRLLLEMKEQQQPTALKR